MLGLTRNSALALFGTITLVVAIVDGLSFSPIRVTTRTRIPNQSPDKVQAFLASPANWPKIVTSSVGVKVPSRDSTTTNDLSRPLPKGQQVEELFGLPPLLPLSVTWTCTKSLSPKGNQNDKKGGIFAGSDVFVGLGRKKERQQPTSNISAGRLVFFSANGLDGVAQNCEMAFDIQQAGSSKNTQKQEDEKAATEVLLTMSYTPVSILALLAVPVLTLDNAVALKFLLPAAMKESPSLDQFRSLMGSLYLFAGLAHLVDCVAGPSQLLTMAGAPTFDMLPQLGQLYAILWCFTGPLSFALSRKSWSGGAGYADIGLILYGLVEVIGAGLVELNYDSAASTGMMLDVLGPFANAILVQGIVTAAWFYSANKE